MNGQNKGPPGTPQAPPGPPQEPPRNPPRTPQGAKPPTPTYIHHTYASTDQDCIPKITSFCLGVTKTSIWGASTDQDCIPKVISVGLGVSKTNILKPTQTKIIYQKEQVFA